MITFDDYPDIERKVEQLRRQRDETRGVLRQQQQQFAQIFNVKSLSEAQALLQELEEQEHQLLHTYNEAFEEFKEQWSAVLKNS